MSEPSELPLAFYGKDAQECDDFIQSVRMHAYKKSKTNDDVWISQQVYPCFYGKALRWYLKLPRDVRDDWELLQQALVQEWPSIEEESSIQPIPAAAAPSTSNAPQAAVRTQALSPSPPRTGLISVKLPDEPQFLGYLSKNLAGSSGKDFFRGSFTITRDIRESLEVTLLQTETPGIWRLGVKDLNAVDYLAAYFIGSYKSRWGMIIGTQRAPTGRSSGSTTFAAAAPEFHGHVYHTDAWEIGSQENLMFRWPEGGGAAIHIVAYQNTNLGFLKNFEKARYSSAFRKAELVFLES